MRRLNFPIVIAVLLATAALIAAAPAWVRLVSGEERNPFRYTNSPFPVLNSPVTAGGETVIVIGRCNDADAPLVYSFPRTLRRLDPPAGEETVIALAPGSSAVDPGCHVVTSRVTVIPADIPPGLWRIEYVATVPGEERTWLVPGQTEPFEVIGP